MLLKKKLNLERFKKSMQGLIEFATLIEQAEPGNREKILRDSTAQDPDFVARALRKVVYFDELGYMDELILAEVLSNISPKVLAHALHGASTLFRTSILKQLGYRSQKALIDEEEKISKEVSQQFVLGAQKQILKMARTLETQGKFVFELHDCPRLTKSKKSKA